MCIVPYLEDDTVLALAEDGGNGSAMNVSN